MKKNKIKYMSKNDYLILFSTGVFWKLYPEATGNYEIDKKMSKEGKFMIEKT